MKTAIVDGIEKQGFLHLGLGCDFCDARYNGGNGGSIAGPYKPQGYMGYEENKIREDARSVGWTGPMTRDSTTDRCPACSHKEFGGKTLPIKPLKLDMQAVRWFKNGDHPLVDTVFGVAFIDMPSADGSLDRIPVYSGCYIVEIKSWFGNTISVMDEENFKKNFEVTKEQEITWPTSYQVAQLCKKLACAESNQGREIWHDHGNSEPSVVLNYPRKDHNDSLHHHLKLVNNCQISTAGWPVMQEHEPGMREMYLVIQNKGAYAITFDKTIRVEGGQLPTLTPFGTDILKFRSRGDGVVYVEMELRGLK